MKRKQLTLIFALLVFSLPAVAIFGGKGLDRLLHDVKTELKDDWMIRQSEQERLQQEYEEQHSQMLEIIKDCNELSMALYLQKNDYTFDLSNALQRVNREYREFSRSRTPYDIAVRNLDMEIDRYARFMEALRRLPPEIQKLDVDLVPDSLTYHNDTLDTFLSQSGSSLEREVIAIAMADTIPSPFVLSDIGQADRDTCLYYAGELLKIYAEKRATVLSDSLHYTEAYLRLKESYDYANTRYKVLQQEIFVEGQTPWWDVVAHFDAFWQHAWEDAHTHYSLSGVSESDGNLDQMDSKTMNTYLFLLVALLLLVLLLAWLAMRVLTWLLYRFIKPLRKRFPREKVPYVSLILGVLLYLILISNRTGNLNIDTAVEQIATFLWLLAAIALALLIRLKPEKMKNAFRLYLPTMFMALAVILCRVSFMPNQLLNVIFPPVLIVIFLWQLVSCLVRGEKAEKSDRVICWISFLFIGIATVLAVCGYVFLALMILVWWYFQLAAIHSLAALGHLITRYREKYMNLRLEKATQNLTMVNGADKNSLLFSATWFYDLITRVVLPCLALASVPLCILHSLDIFDFDTLFHQFYHTPFLQIPGQEGEDYFRMSVESILWVVALFFIFRYANKAFHALWQQGRYHAFIRKNKRKTIRANEINLSLGNSLISVGVWFIYIVCVVELFNIPTGSLSLAIGGLSAGIGLAMKDIINNFIYGIQLMSGRLRVGDWIECEGVRGQVTDINYQSTQVETEEATTVSFLNATLFGKSFTNLTKGNSYQFLKILVSVSYGTDVEKVRQVLEKAMEVMKTKDKYGRDMVDPRFGIYIRFGEFSDSSIQVAVKQFVLAAEHIAYRDRAKEIIYNALKENGITIPFPQRDIHIINGK